MRRWFWADTHFGHSNILEFTSRPWADVHEHDLALTRAWNTVVEPSDHVWVLGDFSFKSPVSVQERLACLRGHKHLVIGNHDRPCNAQGAWASQQHYVELDSLDKSARLVLMHYPIAEWNGKRRGSFHLFGHVHGTHTGESGSMDVGVDALAARGLGYQPISEDVVIQLLRSPRQEAQA